MKVLNPPPMFLALLDQATTESSWPEPEPIQHQLPDVPQMTISMLPTPLQCAIRDIVHRMRCPVEFVAVPMICALGATIGTTIHIRPKEFDDWQEVPNCWAAIVAGPGRMKSPALGSALAPIYQIDRLNKLAFDQAKSAYDVALLQHEAQEDALKQELRTSNRLIAAGKPLTGGVRTPQLIQNDMLQLKLNPPKEPARVRCFTNDATLEALGSILADNPRGILVIADELMGLLAGFEKPGREQERQGYLTGWNGSGTQHCDRVSRGHIEVDPFCISVLGGIQPERLSRYMNETLHGHGNDGLLQRFQLLVYPDDPPLGPINDLSPDKAAQDDLKKLFQKIFYQATHFGAEVDNGVSFFRFDSTAQPHVLTWLGDIERKSRSEEHGIMAEHLAKYRKLVPALSLIFHVVDIAADAVPPGTRIPLTTFQLALAWADFLEAHARRVYSISTNYTVQAATALAKKIKSGALVDGFTHRDIQRHNWSKLQDLEAIRAACDELELAGWIRRVNAGGPPRPGRPKAVIYEINPAVSGKAAPGVSAADEQEAA